MAPPQFDVRLQKGIIGGFAPPLPDAIHLLSHGPADPSQLLIQSQVRTEGTRDIVSAAPKKIGIKREDDSDPVATKVRELHSILKDLPTEQPPGSEDIYGLNTSIAWQSDDLVWVNGGPQGCGHGESEVQPTEEQKKKFARAVELVDEIVKHN